MPALVGPTIAILKPSLILSPTFWSFNIFSISFLIFLTSVWIFSKISSGKSSSGKSIFPSTLDNIFINLDLKELNFSELFPDIILIACCL